MLRSIKSFTLDLNFAFALSFLTMRMAMGTRSLHLLRLTQKLLFGALRPLP